MSDNPSIDELELLQALMFFGWGSSIVVWHVHSQFTDAMTDLMPLNWWAFLFLVSSFIQVYATLTCDTLWKRRMSLVGLFVWGYLELASYDKFGYKYTSCYTIGAWVIIQVHHYRRICTQRRTSQKHERPNA